MNAIAVTEREALLLQIVEQKKQDPITEIEEYRKKRQGAKDSQTNAVTEPAIAPESQTISKPAKKSQRQTTRGKVLAGDSSRGRRRSVETSVGRRVPTPPTEQLAWQSPEESSEWIKVATGKWQTRKHLQDTGAPISAAEITMVEKFETVHQLLTSDGKWQTFLSHQMPLRASQAQLTIEDL
ncbi:unnamed protein product [Phytophthora lilii]|uniref:Unnamed protein product n=1 Tax=Phytophthora lilii TaxID=2077276 RepID=A0A9W6U7X5_9STRA|nr:unnamed protein product [Phytophthora lilii]